MSTYTYKIGIIAQYSYTSKYPDWQDYWHSIVSIVNQKLVKSGIDNLIFLIAGFKQIENVTWESKYEGADINLLLEVAEDKKHLKGTAYFKGNNNTNRIMFLRYNHTKNQIASQLLHEIGHFFGCGFPELYTQRIITNTGLFESKWCNDCMDIIQSGDEVFNSLHKQIILSNIDKSKESRWLKEAVLQSYSTMIHLFDGDIPIKCNCIPVKISIKPKLERIHIYGYEPTTVFISISDAYYSYLMGTSHYAIKVNLTKKSTPENYLIYLLSLIINKLKGGVI